ncbi:MAG: hypothetical protein KF819_12180 [Labilithrix sp.]|nr:hypothetical protein [Labilithrix sp.]
MTPARFARFARFASMFAPLALVACKMDGEAAIEPACGGASQPACASGATNGDRANVDCGATQSPKCADGKACRADESCESGWCNAGVCATPRGDDGVKNGDESDVDCGGAKTGAPRCATGRACAAAADCARGGCSYEKVCIDRPSCVPHYGGDTCGEGEPDAAGSAHESCCTSLPLPVPDAPVSMDKYQVTAGRMRVFLDAVGGDVRKFVRAHRPAGWDPLWDDFVPNGWNVDTSIPEGDYYRRAHSSVWHQLGGTALLDKLGKDGNPFRYGCFINTNGTHTYRMPDDVQTGVLEDVPHKYAQEILDAKALNCVTALVLMAFCEWDWPGSRLPTYAETRFAWHAGDPKNHKFPWGNTPAPVGFLYEGDVFGPDSGKPEPSGRYGKYAVVPNNAAGVTGELGYANWKYSYAYPEDPQPSTMFPDFSAYVSAPGRFPKGNGPFGHADLAGNLFDLTSTIAGSPGTHPNDRELTWGRNGAWEGHEIPFASEDAPWTAPIMRKYGKAGGRCVK